MASWAALNSDERDLGRANALERATEEAQDAHNTALYEQALRYQQQKQVQEAREIYVALIAEDDALSLRLQYLCQKNLAVLELEARAYSTALQHFAHALELDATDVVVWYQMGRAAIETGQLWLARRTLEEGFQVDRAYWPLVQSLCEVLFAIGDYDAYEHIACHVRAHDPQNPSIHLLDKRRAALAIAEATAAATLSGFTPQVPSLLPKSTVKASPRERKRLKRARSAFTQLERIAAETAKRRRVLLADAQLTLTTRSRTVEYLLAHATWHNFGQLLLQVHDDLSATDVQATTFARVHITVTDDVERLVDATTSVSRIEACAGADAIARVDRDAVAADTRSTERFKQSDAVNLQAPRAALQATKCTKRSVSIAEPPVDTATGTTAATALVIPSDTEAALDSSNFPLSELNEPQPTRRKSRRHEERLREEHAAAAKLAREKNLAFRLQAFLPEHWRQQLDATVAAATGGSSSAQLSLTPEKLANWPERFTLELQGASFQIVDATNASVLHDIALLSVPGHDAVGRAYDSSDRGSDTLLGDGVDATTSDVDATSAATGSCASAISKREVAAFVARVGALAPSAVALLTLYLNQCGVWFDRRLASGDSDDEDEIHAVCFWAEKLLLASSTSGSERRLLHSTTTTAATVGMMITSSHATNKLTPLAKLLLLELKFDKLIRQTTLGPKHRKKHLQQLHALLASADSLLLELCWADDDGSDTSASNSTATGLVRLFWLLARIHERCGRASAAKDNFIKCQDALLAAANNHNTVIALPNQRVDAAISLRGLTAKIAGLQFTDVCAEARRCFAAANYDRAASLLLEHFFPATQPPRIVVLLREFESPEAASSTTATTTITAATESNERRLIDILVDSFTHSLSHTADDALLLLLTLLFHVTQFIESLSDSNATSGVLHPEQILDSALSANKFVLVQLRANLSAACRTVSAKYALLLQACCVLILKPSILLLFDAPKDAFQSVCVVLALCNDSTASGNDDLVVDAVAHAFHTIRSLTEAAFRDLCAKLPAQLASKKKQSSRRDRIRALVVELLRFLNARVCSSIEEDANALDAHKRSMLMLHCRTLLKEEEDVIARRDDRTAQQLFGNAAILFVLLSAASVRSLRVEQARTTLTDLVALLHSRMGQYDMCSLPYSADGMVNGASDAVEHSCFLETTIHVLSRYTDANIHAKRRQVDGSEAESGAAIAPGDVDSRFNHELAQCYHCLYDVQLLPGCDDHKTGNSLAQLQQPQPQYGNAKATTQANAMRLAQFAVPILLARPPKTNSQKKENVKVLNAIREAVFVLHATASATAATTHRRRHSELQSFLTPSSLLEWSDRFPVIQDDSDTSGSDVTGLEAPLHHLWYLLGENFILSRVRRRGNATELQELETRVKERVAFLRADVLQYRPGRIKSWIRLGKTMKELYHATSDACAVLLGRRRRVAALQQYTSRLVCAAEPGSSNDSASDENATAQRSLAFNDVVLGTSLFEQMRRWDECDATKKDAFRVGIWPTEASASGTGLSDTTVVASSGSEDVATIALLFSIEEFAIYYMVQVIEFARRCFAMAAHLAEAALEAKLAARRSGTDATDGTNDGADDSVRNDDVEIDALRTTVVESNEESGLLLYNVLQELSVLVHETPATEAQPSDAQQSAPALFPDALAHRVANAALTYFQKGLDVCANVTDVDEVRFRLNFMCGKTLKKQLRRAQAQSAAGTRLTTVKLSSSHATPSAVLDCFARAETAHEDGEMEHALVHAFYALQAMRMEIILRQSVRVAALRLVCEHYFEEEEEEEDDSVDNDSAGSGEDTGSTQPPPSASNATVRSATDSVAAASTNNSTIVKMTKDDVFQLLERAEAHDSSDDACDLALHTARGWLYLNVIDALESIPNEDRYFHPSRYVLAQGVYRMDEFIAHTSFATSTDTQVRALVAALTDRLHVASGLTDAAADVTMPTTAAAAARALKELAPLFDKKRPQIVAIWLSEHVPIAKKFEELNQRQIKYDRYRLKYWRLYMALLEETGAYSRLREMASWVLACKEEHDVIDEMLALALRARGNVLRLRVREFRVDPGTRDATNDAGDAADAVADSAISNKQHAAALVLFKLLAKTFTFYVDVVDAHQRLADVLTRTDDLQQHSELLLVHLYVLGVRELPDAFPHSNASNDVTATVDSISRWINSDEVDSASSAVAALSVQWRALFDATRAFCEAKWPERMGKSKVAKPRVRAKPTIAAANTNASVSVTAASGAVLTEQSVSGGLQTSSNVASTSTVEATATIAGSSVP